MRTLAHWMMEYTLNAAWQVPLVFATAWIVTRVGRRVGAAFEHRVWVGALLLEVELPACSVRPAELMRELMGFFAGSHASQVGLVTVTMGPGHVQGGLQMASALLVGAMVLYGGCLVYFTVRLGMGLRRTSLLRRKASSIELSGASSEGFRRFAGIFGVPDAVAAVSAEIAGPVTIGVRRPVLLLPVGMESVAQQDDLDVAFAHEFAHMSRNDFAKNILYEVLSLPIAFHPLLWMTRTRVAESREMVCDAMAADAVAGRQDYARSLLRLASNFSSGTQPANFHAIGIFDANHFGNFERRIMNLTEKRIELRGARRAAVATAGVLLGFGACASALALRVQVAAPQSEGQKMDAMVRGQIHAMVAREIVAQSVQNAPVTSLQTTAQSAPDHVLVAVPSDGEKPKASFQIELDPAQIAAAETDSATGLKVVPIGKDMENVPIPQDSRLQANPGVMAGNVLTKVTPVYPQEAKDEKVQGAVVLDAVIGKDGAIKSLRVLSGPNELTNSALEAVKQWTYKPYLLNGNPTEVETTITVNYTLAQ